MPISISGSGTITGISAGGLPDGCITTDDIAAAAVTTAKLGSNEASGLCKAWVNFDGTGNGTFAGGTSTVTRASGSTTATVTTTNNHGLITGNTVYALTGVVAGSYTVTVLTATTFTITTVATTALSAVSITFAVNTIRASYNVSSITDNGVGDYTVNFTTAMPDANFSTYVTSGATISGGNYFAGAFELPTTSSVNAAVFRGDSWARYDRNSVSVAIFR